MTIRQSNEALIFIESRWPKNTKETMLSISEILSLLTRALELRNIYHLHSHKSDTTEQSFVYSITKKTSPFCTQTKVRRC